MKIAPIDIAHKTFSKKLMGIEPEEVNEFLRLVSDEMETLIREKNSLKEALREKDLQILEYKERDKVLRDTITSAQRMSEKLREEAERESNLILQDANQKAETIVRDARDSLKRVYNEIADIKRAKIQFEAIVRSAIMSHSKMLDDQTNIGAYTPKSAISSEFNGVDFTESRSVGISPVSST